MDFDLSEEQRLLQDSVSKLLADSYTFERRQSIRQLTGAHSPELWQQFADLGLLALPFAEADGGLGGGPVDVMLVMEAFGRHLVLEPFLASIVFAGGCLRRLADAAQRARWLPPLMAGSEIAALAHVERAARYDLAVVNARAHSQADHWILEGEKAFVHAGDVATQFIVSARVGDSATDLALFVVRADTPGLERRGYATQDGSHAADLRLRGVRVPKADRLEIDDALGVLEGAVDEGIAALCAEAVGTMSRAHDITVDYLKQRKQFGVPIGSFQALQHRAVDMLVMVEQARSMGYFATMSVGEPDSKRRSAAMSAAKVQLGHSARFVGEQAIQLHGGIGMTEECAIGHYYRRLNLMEMQFGDTAYHLARLAALGGL